VKPVVQATVLPSALQLLSTSSTFDLEVETAKVAQLTSRPVNMAHRCSAPKNDVTARNDW
jgi:hypothetical protein